MCLSPQIIENPNYNAFSRNSRFSYVTDTISRYIVVPCGRCPVCVALKQSYFIQRVQMESIDNIIFYGTLTYNNETLPSIDVNGYNIKYADIRHFQDMIRLIRKNESSIPKFRYFACSEFGGKRHRPHFHFLIFYPKSEICDNPRRIQPFHLLHLQRFFHPLFLKYWRHNEGSRKFPIWVPNCTYTVKRDKRNYDLKVIDTVTDDCSDVAFYVSKYTTKFSDYVDRLKSALYFNLPEDKYRETWNLVKPRFLMSKHFGNIYSLDVIRHIRKGIDFALDHDLFYPIFISPTSGKHFPLAPYYRSKFLTCDEALIFKERILSKSPTGNISDAEISDPLSPSEVLQKFVKFDRTKSLIRSRDCDIAPELDYMNLSDFNLSDFLNTDLLYGQTLKLDPKDLESSDDW